MSVSLPSSSAWPPPADAAGLASSSAQAWAASAPSGPHGAAGLSSSPLATLAPLQLPLPLPVEIPYESIGLISPSVGAQPTVSELLDRFVNALLEPEA